MVLLPEIKDFLKLSKHVDYHTKLLENVELEGKAVVNMMSSVNTFKSKLPLMSSRLQTLHPSSL